MEPYPYEAQLRAAGFGLIAGADEVGRGACAGPLVAAAVILPECGIVGLDDSKKLSAHRRDVLFDRIQAAAQAVAVVAISAGDCDRLGIQEADLQALRRAVLQLDPPPDFALTDGFAVAGLECPNLAIWKGDQVSPAVAAASIVAKVTRDRWMAGAAEQYPGYGFEVHKGYATQAHQAALDRLGPCAIHRMSYANVQRAARVATP